MSGSDKKDTERADEALQSSSEHRMRMRLDWNNLIEDLIQEGQERGAFDDLSGKGKPLDLKRNLYEGERELANTLLKHNKLVPAWISSRNHITAKVQLLREDISRRWARHARAFELAQGDAQRGALTISWDDACLAWQEEILKLNKEIEDFNLRRPSDSLEIFKIRLEEELSRAGAQRWLR